MPDSIATLASYSVTNLDAAQYAVVHDYPGGAVQLGAVAGINPGTLSNKVNPNIETHHLTVKEAVTIQALSKDYRILEAMAALLGHVAVKLPDAPSYSDIELLDAYADWTADIGQTSEAIRRALAGAVVTEQALAEIHREMHEDFGKALVLFARFRTLRNPSHHGGALS